MRELIRTNDLVVIDVARSVLEEAGLLVMIADGHMSGLEGAIGIFPRRIMVVDAEAEEARRVLVGAGLGEWLSAG